MSDEWKNIIGVWVMVIVLIAFAIWFTGFVEGGRKVACMRVEQLGKYNMDYRPIWQGGCLMEVSPGLWLPYNDVAYYFLNQE